MKVRIHRGAERLAVRAIEVEAAGSRIVLDLGRPLNALREEFVPLPGVAGLRDQDPSLLGLVISHGHQDHWGLIDQVSKKIPIHVGEATHRILKEAAFFSSGMTLDPAGFLRHRESFARSLHDHAVPQRPRAFDTHSVLIEADGRRLFYSADLPAHGRGCRNNGPAMPWLAVELGCHQPSKLVS
jgi:ribonuclease J